METPILATSIRGETVESVHRGHVVIVERSGKILYSIGNPDTITYFRSAAKPFQAIPLVTSGAGSAFNFSDEEIAMACASHSGESRHVQLVRRMLKKVGVAEADLRCGSHAPFYQPEAERMIRQGESPTQLHNNCSGKHAGMLAVCKYKGWDMASYECSDHPLQQEILRVVARFAECDVDSIRIGIDGCAAPNFAVRVASMARSFINLTSPDSDEATKRIASAMVSYPELIGGTDRLDTMLMQAAPGKILSKVGADGVWVCAVLPGEKFPKGLGIALKIEDGDDFLSRPVVAVEILRQLGILGRDQLLNLSPMPIMNRRGDRVGRVQALVELE